MFLSNAFVKILHSAGITENTTIQPGTYRSRESGELKAVYEPNEIILILNKWDMLKRSDYIFFSFANFFQDNNSHIRYFS